MIFLPQTGQIAEGDVARVSADLGPTLDNAELLTSAAVEQCDLDGAAVAPPDLTLTAATIPQVDVPDIDRETMAAGRGVQFSITAGQAAGRTYYVKITAQTDQGQTKVRALRIVCK